MNTARLKLETQLDHELAEQSLPWMATVLDRETYVASLKDLHGFIQGWDVWADSIEAGEIRNLLSARRRGCLLVADLQYFAAEVPSALYAGPAIDKGQPAAMLGAIYVVEGSTLGGQYIARHVERALGLTAGQGDSYFRGYQERTGSMWAEVQAALQEVPEEDAETVIAAAKGMFQDFTAWMSAREPL